MKLLTEITISELQQNLKEELYPYFAVGGNTIKSIKSVVDKSIRQPMKLLNFKQINNKKFSSFIESKTKTKKNAEDDFVNVKFAADDQSYPTIEKLVAQMMNRRDLSEKYIRLKILEFETKLQKAENEMIQYILHEYIFKIIMKYGPAIEGLKEHIK